MFWLSEYIYIVATNRHMTNWDKYYYKIAFSHFSEATTKAATAIFLTFPNP